jgi:predicted RNase H-related nuclease YkuK (DUF458 family)
MTTKWKTLNNEPIEDIHEFIRRETSNGQQIHIGTDSLQTMKWTQFVTVVVILNTPKGGRVAYRRDIVPRINSLRKRLMDEVWRSVTFAMELPVNLELTIHIDANPDEKHMSSKYLQALVGLVVGQGFKALYKPLSWASTTVADHVVRSQGKVPRNGAQLALKARVAG